MIEKYVKKLEEKNKEQQKEIERLNNIINEIEKYINQNEDLYRENERLNNKVDELEKYKYAYESIIKSLKGNINFLKRNQLSQDRIDEDEYVLRTLKFYFNNYDKENKE